jgi:predicted nucleic acid-binding protein
MVLVDSTVWIDLLRGRGSPPVVTLRQLLTEGQAVTAPVIVQEVLQGASGPDSLQRLRDHFLSLPMVEPAAGGLTHAAAGELYARCRWQGITPRSPHDCLIAQLAIEHDLPLLHDDHDFEALARVDGRLRLMAVAAAP